MTKRAPWGHVARKCVYCGKVGPRVIVLGGYAHRRCVPKPLKPTTRRDRSDQGAPVPSAAS